MSQKVMEFYEFGGVDSRSNPLNMPSNRSLRCKNWVPMRSGNLRLRAGYTAIPQDAIYIVPIHSLTSFRLLNDARYLVYGQGTNVNRLDLSNGHISAVTVKGSAVVAGRWSWVFAKNMLHGGNGTQVKMVDSVGVMRDSGLPDLAIPNPHPPLNAVHPDFGGVTVAVGAADANGVPASTVGGAQPGYQFYASLWNRVTNHVSNRVAIGSRVAPTVASDISITGLPNCSAAAGWDSEWDILIGRTDDGGEVPHVCAGSDGLWLYCANGSTSITVNVAGTDQNSELPTRNSPPPAFDKMVRVGSRLMGVAPSSPFVYWSESETDAAQSQNYNFVGDSAQCWPANNVETFPTGAKVNCIGECSGGAFVFSLQDMGILSELSGVMGWEGSWQCGAAGWEAFVNTPYGPFWLTGEKQLVTMTQSGPLPVSDEYEASLLARIGDTHLQDVQVRYYRDPKKQIDHIAIKAMDANGNVFRVIHDFTLKDSYLSYTYTSSPTGQGYEDAYVGALAADYTMAQVRDGLDHPQIYAGGHDGRLYQLYIGYQDNGAGFTGDLIGLLNAGEERPLVSYLEWFGDKGVKWSAGMTLDVAGPDGLTDLSSSFEVVPGGEHDYQYRVSVPFPEAKRVYVRAQLTTPGNLALNPNFERPGLFGWATPLDNWIPESGFIAMDSEAVGETTNHFAKVWCIPAWMGGPGVTRIWQAFSINAVNIDPTNTAQAYWTGLGKAGHTVVFSAKMRVRAGSTPSNCKLGLAYTDPSLPFYSVTYADCSGLVVGQWVTVQGSFVLPYNFTLVCPVLEVSAPGPTGSLSQYCDFDDAWVADASVAQNDPLAMNDPPHLPLETFGRIYLVMPNVKPGRGH